MIIDGNEYIELKNFPRHFICKDPIRLLYLKDDGFFRICGQTPNSTKDPYWTTSLKLPNGTFVKRSMHRLLMETFVLNPENKAHVNHIDGDKSNNSINNLEWATPKENAQHACDLGLCPQESKYVEVHQYYLNGEYIQSFASCCIAEQVTGIMKTNISKCTLGDRSNAGGFMWKLYKLPQIPPLDKKLLSHFEVKNLSTGELSSYINVNEITNTLGSKYKNPITKLMDSNKTNQIIYENKEITRIYYK